MPKYNVHRVRFFDYFPQAIHCLAYDDKKNRLALSRADHSVEIWSLDNNEWFQEKIIRNSDDASIEGLVWAEGRLFSAGLCCDVTEYDLCSLQIKQTTPSYSGAVWCLACNRQQTLLAAGTEEGCVTLIDIQDDGLKFLRSFDKQESRILCLAWHPHEDCIVTGGIDNIRLWSCNSGRARQRLTLQRSQRKKEVLVWCVAITKDMTIISGDSCGRTIFWNGKQGTQIKCFGTHRADVQTMCVNETGSRVFSSGVDPVICQFDSIPVAENSDVRRWVRTNSKSRATHDIRALALTKNHLVAGGVDAYLTHATLTKEGTTPIKLIPPIPQASLVSVSGRGLVLFQYAAHLELWKLGFTDSKSDVPGSILPLSSEPVKLAVLKAKEDEQIVCSSLSDDGQWLAYSDSDSLRLFQLQVDLKDLFQPHVTLHRVRYRPLELLPGHRVAFAKDGSLLVSAAVDGSLQVVQTDNVQPSVRHSFPPVKEPCYLLSLSDDARTLASVCHHNDVHLYCLEQMKPIGSLPRIGHRVVALNLSPDGRTVLVAYANREVLEFDVQSRQFTDWTRETIDQWPHFWSTTQSSIRNVQYNPANQRQFFVQDVLSVAVIDKSKQLAPLGVKMEESVNDTKDSTHHVLSSYKDSLF